MTEYDSETMTVDYSSEDRMIERTPPLLIDDCRAVHYRDITDTRPSPNKKGSSLAERIKLPV
jgi:hypothetical protein